MHDCETTVDMADRSVANDEPRWHASLAVIAALILYVTLPPKVTFGPLWLFPLLVLALLVPLSVFAPMRRHETAGQRFWSIILIAIVNLFNVASLALLVNWLVNKPPHMAAASGQHLLVGGIQIWLTNILVFAMWYWELDAGGPEQRAHADSACAFPGPDFFFPQMTTELRTIEPTWKPLFGDYLFLAFSTATALSAADTLPLTRLAKMLMLAQAFVSLVTIAIIISRAINILS
ncbi:MAG: hypothetical protein JO024_06635 [Candidatus Eremiobacteraeota bacterium]|nr:hypothetical protein [Candidatus Eremiobacteraeota bacterium]